MTTKQQKIVGSSEIVDFPEFKLCDVPAKVDTGADTGALHCTKIEEKTVKGRQVIEFSPFDKPEVTITADVFSRRHVRSSNGQAKSRYFISTVISVQGVQYPIQLSLADRTEMTWPVLIGKRFLADNEFLVDVNIESPISFAEKELS